MREFKGKYAVVTGAGSGIGAALARRAAAEGMNVVLADMQLRRRRGGGGGDACGSRRWSCAATSSDEASVAAWPMRPGIASAPSTCCATTPGSCRADATASVWEYTPGDWQWSLGVNLYGVINGLRAFVPRMIAQGTAAHILNTASVAGFVSGSGSACYGAAKHAMVRASEALYAGLREEAAPIGVTLLCPGLVRTRSTTPSACARAAFADAGRARAIADLEAMREELYRNAATPEEAADLAFEGIVDDQLSSSPPPLSTRPSQLRAEATPRAHQSELREHRCHEPQGCGTGHRVTRFAGRRASSRAPLGIGLETVRRLVAEGGVSPSSTATGRASRPPGGRSAATISRRGDGRHRRERLAALADTSRRHGAGSTSSSTMPASRRFVPIADTSLEQWRAAIAVNLEPSSSVRARSCRCWPRAGARRDRQCLVDPRYRRRRRLSPLIAQRRARCGCSPRRPRSNAPRWAWRAGQFDPPGLIETPLAERIGRPRCAARRMAACRSAAPARREIRRRDPVSASDGAAYMTGAETRHRRWHDRP